jgi:hypothetical protein
MKFLYRPVREYLCEAVEEIRTFTSLEELVVFLRVGHGYCANRITPESIEFVSQGFDGRIGWDSHLVFVDGYGVFGYTSADPRSGKVHDEIPLSVVKSAGELPDEYNNDVAFEQYYIKTYGMSPHEYFESLRENPEPGTKP